MSSRHLARSIVMQTLFEWDFNGCDDKKIDTIIEQNLEEFAPGEGDILFTKNLVKNILKKRKAIDAIVEKAAPEWPLEKISIVDRNVLRIGLFELLFADRGEVPPKVAINEAIELAKTFSGDTGGRFVNGVLGAVYRELGEPGKDEVAKKKAKKNAPADITKLPIERLGGAVVYARKDGKIYLAFVHDIFAHWTLSKGKLEEGENEEEGMKREIREELGVDIVVKGRIGENEYIASDPERGKIRKHVTYFLGETKYQKLTLGSSGGLQDARWFGLEEVPELPMYDDVIPLVTKGIKMIPK